MKRQQTARGSHPRPPARSMFSGMSCRPASLAGEQPLRPLGVRVGKTSPSSSSFSLPPAPHWSQVLSIPLKKIIIGFREEGRGR